jgi:hypothetical protein
MPKIGVYTAANSMAPGQEMKFQLQEEMCEPHWICYWQDKMFPWRAKSHPLAAT